MWVARLFKQALRGGLAIVSAGVCVALAMWGGFGPYQKASSYTICDWPIYFIRIQLTIITSYPVKNHLPGLAGSHYIKGFLKFIDMKFMGDHRGNIEFASEHGRHLVPCLKHLSSVNTL